MNYKIIDLDFGSYYLGLIDQIEIYPKHLGKDFLNTTRLLTKQRLDAKEKNDKITSDGLKIAIVSLFGKMGFEEGYLFDPEALLSVTINGQMCLLALIELLEQQIGIECFYANTDGATFKVTNEYEDIFYTIANNYAKELNIPIEYDEYSKVFIRDVNNYIIEKTNGSLKEKGAYLQTDSLAKSFDMPVVKLAAKNYLIDNIPIEETIKTHWTNDNNILDYCKSQKVGKSFNVVSYKYDKELKKLISNIEQNTNRYLVVNYGSKLFKEDIYKNKKRQIDLCAGYYVELFNDYYYSNDYNLNYSYYISEAKKLTSIFEKTQLTLW